MPHDGGYDWVEMRMSRKPTTTQPSPADAISPYPYGLRLHLEDEQLSTLGIEELPKVGATVEFHAKAEVASISQSEKTQGHPRRQMEWQITHLAMEEPRKLPPMGRL